MSGDPREAANIVVTYAIRLRLSCESVSTCSRALALTQKSEEVLYDSEVEALYNLSYDPVLHTGFFRHKRSYLKDILLHHFILPADIPCQY
jgi:hypothetical protein